jgi:hypothetical protein
MDGRRILWATFAVSITIEKPWKLSYPWRFSLYNHTSDWSNSLGMNHSLHPRYGACQAKNHIELQKKVGFHSGFRPDQKVWITEGDSELEAALLSSTFKIYGEGGT